MRHIAIFLIALVVVGCQTEEINKPTQLLSPDQNISINFKLTEYGEPSYQVKYKEDTIIKPSLISMDFQDVKSLKSGFELVKVEREEKDETWDMPWGEQLQVKNKYYGMTVRLKEIEAPNREFNIYFRAYNDGIGFRYEILPFGDTKELIVMDENTSFNLTKDYDTWWIPGDWDIYEHLYNSTKLSKINAISKRDNADLAQTHIPENAVNTPFTLRASSGLHLSFHEANLTNYPGMTLKVDTTAYSLSSELVGSDRLGYKAKIPLPFKTPWRSIQISEDAGGLIESKLIVNLNEPNKLGDVSWFKPMKYVGIWWEMHLGKSSWDISMQQDMTSFTEDTATSSTHGATTENTKKYIDFAAENGFGGVLVEGWNTGWEHWIGFEDREGVFDFVTPYPDYNLTELAKYARSKGVGIIMHNETSAAPRSYEQQLDTAFNLMESLGIHSVKTGYVGKIIPKGEYHHGQWMVNHYRKVLETGAGHKVAINAHEPIKATGIRRTYPNAIAREGLRGQEFNAWASDGGNPPEHLPIVAFTRMLAGPIDFTPGVFNIKLNPWKKNNQVNTTLAQQLALYVVIYSPIQMACDLPENYEGQPAFQFIKDVGVDWQVTKVLNGEVGEYVTIARKERETGDWFVGGITNEDSRNLSVAFDFLDEGKAYKAKIYKDGEDAHWDDNPTAIKIEEKEITADQTLDIKLAPGGGFAISLVAKE